MAPVNPLGQMGPMMPNMVKDAMNQVAMLKLMTVNKLDQESADYFTQVKTELVSQSDTSIHYRQTFPEGAKADTTVTLMPGQRYTPTPAELENAARTGAAIYNVKLAVQAQGPHKVHIALQYFVPQGKIPLDLQQKLHLQSSAGSVFDLVPNAWAQGGEGPGMAIASDTSMETFKEIAKDIIEEMGEGTKLAEYGPNLTYGLLYGLSGVQKYMEHSEWMDQLEEMQHCAQENPLNKKAMENPADTTKSGLDDARSEIRQVSAIRGLNVATAFASMFVPGAFGTVMTPVATWNDESLKELGERDLQDIKKSVPTCKEQPARQATFEYIYTRTEDGPRGHDVENRTAEGDFDLSADPMVGGLYNGEGSANYHRKEHFNNKRTDQHMTTTGQLELNLRGIGSPRSQTFDITFHGENLTNVNSCAGCEMTVRNPNTENDNSGFARTCKITGVDMIRGGTYSAQVDLDYGYGTCKIKVPGQ